MTRREEFVKELVWSVLVALVAWAVEVTVTALHNTVPR
jgi:hypothetical protein